MPVKILMPALSPTMTEGKLANWLKQEGDEVKAGDVIAEIETDKATMEVEAVDEGRLGRILVPAGTEGVPVNQAIAYLLEEGEDASDLTMFEENAKGAPSIPEPTAEAQQAQQQAKAEAKPVPQPAPEQPSGAQFGGSAAGAHGGAVQPGAGGDRVFASPLARRMAEQAGLDLGRVQGSGPNGRIVKADVEAALSGKPAAAPQPAQAAVAPSQAPAQPGPAAVPPKATGPSAKDLADKLGIPYKAVPNSGMRKVIARRLTESKQTVPHFYLTIDCEIDALLRIRKELNARDASMKLSVNDFVIRAAALALRKVPAANASWTDDAVLLYERADISVAVATEGGLITPIVKGADSKGLAQISAETKDLASRARAGKLKPEEFQGGTFSVSNLGMFGIKHFEAVINPPQACILAVGAGEQRPVVKDGALAVATVMSCTLSVDHRAVDGAVGAEYLAAFRKLVEDPLQMLL